jgi:hypothetical protein
MAGCAGFTDVTAFRAIDIGGEHLSRALQTSPRLAALQLTAAETNMIKEHTGLHLVVRSVPYL